VVQLASDSTETQQPVETDVRGGRAEPGVEGVRRQHADGVDAERPRARVVTTQQRRVGDDYTLFQVGCRNTTTTTVTRAEKSHTITNAL